MAFPIANFITRLCMIMITYWQFLIISQFENNFIQLFFWQMPLSSQFQIFSKLCRKNYGPHCIAFRYSSKELHLTPPPLLISSIAFFVKSLKQSFSSHGIKIPEAIRLSNNFRTRALLASYFNVMVSIYFNNLNSRCKSSINLFF